jgi:hypothetical protein
MKPMLGAIAVAAALAVGGGLSSAPAFAQTSKTASAANAVGPDRAAVSATDMSAQRYHRRHRVVRPFPVYPYGARHYRRPVVYPYAYTPYPYAYYRPRPVYYRPYPYYAPAPFFRVGFGPRYYW